MTISSLTRLYTFSSGSVAVSAQVNAELNQIISTTNELVTAVNAGSGTAFAGEYAGSFTAKPAASTDAFIKFNQGETLYGHCGYDVSRDSIIISNGTSLTTPTGYIEVTTTGDANIVPKAGRKIYLDTVTSVDGGIFTTAGPMSIVTTGVTGSLAITSATTLTLTPTSGACTINPTSGGIVLTPSAGNSVSIDGMTVDGGVITRTGAITITPSTYLNVSSDLYVGGTEVISSTGVLNQAYVETYLRNNYYRNATLTRDSSNLLKVTIDPSATDYTIIMKYDGSNYLSFVDNTQRSVTVNSTQGFYTIWASSLGSSLIEGSYRITLSSVYSADTPDWTAPASSVLVGCVAVWNSQIISIWNAELPNDAQEVNFTWSNTTFNLTLSSTTKTYYADATKVAVVPMFFASDIKCDVNFRYHPTSTTRSIGSLAVGTWDGATTPWTSVESTTNTWREFDNGSTLGSDTDSIVTLHLMKTFNGAITQASGTTGFIYYCFGGDVDAGSNIVIDGLYSSFRVMRKNRASYTYAY